MTTKPQSHGKQIPYWIDALILLVIFLVAGGAITLNGRAEALGLPLIGDDRLSWHLIRSLGLTAYTLLAASTIWGIFLATRVIKDWSPGTVNLLLHASVSWLAVALAFGHAGLLMLDSYFSYHISDVLIPFAGPYRPFAVGLGTLAAWLAFAVAISFSLRKVIGQKAWRWLHYTSYVTFGLVMIHALLAGTDAARPGMALVSLVFVLIASVLLGWRLKQRATPAATARGKAQGESRAA